MALTMFGPLILLAASVSPSTAPVPPVAQRQVVVRASATATIRIVSGVKFGADQPKDAPGADRRKALLADASGTLRSAELLEFQ